MRFLSVWGDVSGDGLVYFAPAVLEVFERYIQGEQDAEAGGILLGHVRGIHVEVLEVTVPTPRDQRLKYFFERMLHGHQRIAEIRWKDSNRLIRYLGEWHTHPEDIPTPSGLDISEWQRLAKGRRDGRPMLATIVGRQDLRVEYMSSSGVRRRLSPMSE
ncbi:Mov34/MPN/PAD-1 family protein [Pseudomonas nitroreducens]|uniref:Mov34/MPN/PAD-1 family protein n=1 Tax=Pseudomonas nitroreducens TaxID=46680 RepID=UPI0003696939|nr:Mov34/MPN/PAD-1 family protein [Pseudomonas nitroreducens]